MTPPAQNQVTHQARGASSEASSSTGLPIIFSREDWRNPTRKEQRIVNAVCSGVMRNEHAKLLRSMKSFAEEHDTEPDDDATIRFVTGIMRMLNNGRLVSVQPMLDQGQSSFALVPSNGNVTQHLTMMGSHVNGLGNNFLNLDMLLASCLSYHRDDTQSDASSTLASEGGAPEGYLRLQGRRVQTIECDCQGDCHHMDKTAKVPPKQLSPTDKADEYQDGRVGGRLGAIMRTVMDCLVTIFGKVPGFRVGGRQQDVERNTAAKRASSRDRS